MIISIDEARSILEQSGLKYKDDEIEQLVGTYTKWIDLAIDSFIQKKKNINKIINNSNIK